jgi:putative transposase
MLAERMLAAELSHHLANEEGAGNHRSGSNQKTVLPPGGEMRLTIPRDRLDSFEPKLVAKHQPRMSGFDDHVISMYARGMSVREIQGHLPELYGTRVSPDVISTITDKVTQWQQRPLETMYPIVYFDALRLKIRDEGTVKSTAVYLAPGVRADGRDSTILQRRKQVYEAAKKRRPQRWTGETRDWNLKNEVWLNPDRNQPEELQK